MSEGGKERGVKEVNDKEEEHGIKGGREGRERGEGGIAGGMAARGRDGIKTRLVHDKLTSLHSDLVNTTYSN